MKVNIKSQNNVDHIINQFNLNKLQALILNDFNDNQIKSLLSKELNLKNPHHFKNMEIAITRIKSAITRQEKILIYGDYDCDGIMATSIMVSAFKQLGVEVGYYIPNRFKDGYGLNAKFIELFKQKGYSLIITVDNGISAIEALNKAQQLDIDVIVTDHHHIKTKIDDLCYTVLHPEYNDCLHNISGAFVAFKLASALLNRFDNYLTCLAGITILSDVMPVVGENRTLLKRMNQLINGFDHFTLLTSNSITYNELNSTIIPKINSIGRLSDFYNPNQLVKYFTSNDQTFKNNYALELTKINNHRKLLSASHYERIKNDLNYDQGIIFVLDDQIHEGVIGLSASRLLHDYHVPTFIMTKSDENENHYKGSGRSFSDFSLIEILKKIEDKFIALGGHAQAAGFTFDQAQKDEIYHFLNKAYLENKNDDYLVEVIEVNQELLTVENIDTLCDLEPFGNKFDQPQFFSQDLTVKSLTYLKENKHVKIKLEKNNQTCDYLIFNIDQSFDLQENDWIDIIFKSSINIFNKRKSVSNIITNYEKKVKIF